MLELNSFLPQQVLDAYYMQGNLLNPEYKQGSEQQMKSLPQGAHICGWEDHAS